LAVSDEKTPTTEPCWVSLNEMERRTAEPEPLFGKLKTELHCPKENPEKKRKNKSSRIAIK
jgi:hypothetical protein